MEENIVSLLTDYRFAIFVEDELVLINNCDERMAAILNSNPRFEEVVE